VCAERLRLFAERNTCYVHAAEETSRFLLMTDAPRKILILGGYGTFGGRLARLLSTEARLTLVIAGRSEAAARAFCETLPPGAAREAQAVNRDADLGRRFAEIAPDLVVDASGPFQAYRDDPYRVVKAALAFGAHYLDFADGSAFVRGISGFDQLAREAGLVVLSGVSSFPVLTAAVVRHLSRDLDGLDSITGGIAPSPYAGVGLNVIRAIAGYAGTKIPVRRGGGESASHALIETRRYTIAPPGFMPLHSTAFSLVDVPDLQLLTDLHPEVQSVWMGAGPVPAILHRLLRWLAHCVRAGLLPSLAPVAWLMHRTINVVRWGEDRGGMFVEIVGRRGGSPVTRSWHLLAEGDDGPFIPSMAIEAIVRNWLEGRAPRPGARAALEELEVSDYEKLFVGRRIHTGSRLPAGADECLYKRLLGEAWRGLPASIRSLHDAAPRLRARGKATVVRGTGLLSRTVARIFHFPEAAAEVDVSVDIHHRDRLELWTRNFGGRPFSSVQYSGRGCSERLLCERFGPFVFAMALVTESRRLKLIVRRWSIFGIPLPRVLAPGGNSFEFEDEGRFRFHVEIRSTVTGLIVRYTGYLELEPDSGAEADLDMPASLVRSRSRPGASAGDPFAGYNGPVGRHSSRSLALT
jgi:hypothetical protein